MQLGYPGHLAGGQIQGFHLPFGDEQGLKAAELLSDERLHQLLADFLGGDHPPRGNLMILVGGHSPLHAGRVEPAILAGLAAMVRVDFAVDFDAVQVIAPNIRPVIPIAVDQAAQGPALGIQEQPGSAALALGPLDLAGLDFLRRRRTDLHPGLLGRVVQNLIRFRRPGGAAPQQQAARQQPRTDACLRHPPAPFKK